MTLLGKGFFFAPPPVPVNAAPALQAVTLVFDLTQFNSPPQASDRTVWFDVPAP